MAIKSHISQAIASDPRYALDLAPNFTPDIDVVLSEGVVCFGVKGAGKSNACARLVEQISRYPMPYLVCDTKGEYTRLDTIKHASTFIVATANNCPSGHHIISQRLHVVMDLRSWDSEEGAALAMAQVLGELFAYASTQNPSDCVPCPVILDEAQYWLPQAQVSYLSKEIARELRDAWHVTSTRGRSLGLVPSFFTQNISELHKSVMRQAGIFILMRQTLDNDLDRYGEYIHGLRPARLKAIVRAFAAGRAFVILPNGEQIRVTFHARESLHPSHTPTIRDLMRRLGQDSQTQKVVRRRGKARKVQESRPSPTFERIHTALAKDSHLSPMELAAACECDLETAKQARYSFFYGGLTIAK